jgi:sulfinoalanine decarboxylase / aspartate 1-decarboxylase
MAGAPLQCSLVMLRERGLLARANAAAAAYLFQQDKFYDVRYDTGDKSVQCGRKVYLFTGFFEILLCSRQTDRISTAIN